MGHKCFRWVLSCRSLTNLILFVLLLQCHSASIIYIQDSIVLKVSFMHSNMYIFHRKLCWSPSYKCFIHDLMDCWLLFFYFVVSKQAYCLYRQNKLDEALEALKRQERNDESMLLESQILYRLGKMDACLDIFQKLQKSKIDSLEINSVAALVMAGRSSEVQGLLDSLRVKATSSFELAYNTACSLIEGKKYTDAEQLLLSGRRWYALLIVEIMILSKFSATFSWVT